jgi:hypothetical protein
MWLFYLAWLLLAWLVRLWEARTRPRYSTISLSSIQHRIDKAIWPVFVVKTRIRKRSYI